MKKATFCILGSIDRNLPADELNDMAVELYDRSCEEIKAAAVAAGIEITEYNMESSEESIFIDVIFYEEQDKETVRAAFKGLDLQF
jgi:hypothetical protein